MWMVRAGEGAFLIDDFKELNIVAIGWEVENLSGKNSDEIKHIMRKKYPQVNNRSLGQNSSQVIKFVCDFEIGDYVISFNPKTQKYLIGKITSDYYYSHQLARKNDESDEFYSHCRDVKWIGETKNEHLTENSLKPLKASLTIFNLNSSVKNELLYNMNSDKVEWTDFYMEFADKLLEFKDNRTDLINKILNIFKDLDMRLPTLEVDDDGNMVDPFDIDPFTIFALFNKQISAETRINIITQIKKEFSLNFEVPNTFHGIAVVNNLKATFYYFSDKRGEEDIDNLWKLFEIALNYSDDVKVDFIEVYDKVINQRGIKWNITMALNWIRPFDFINLDSNNRNLLSEDSIFSKEFQNEIKSLTTSPNGQKYLHICEEVKNAIKQTGKYDNFPKLSHAAYLINSGRVVGEAQDSGIGDGDVKTTKYWLISAGYASKWWDDFYDNGNVGIGFDGIGDLRQYEHKKDIVHKFQEINGDKSAYTNNSHACWQFVHDMQIGDVIFVKKGWGEIIGRGIVESDYEYDENNEYSNIRQVNWTHRGSWISKERLPTKTLTDITIYQEFVNNIKNLFVDEDNDLEEVKEYPEYSKEDFLKEAYVSVKDYEILKNLVKNKKNLIIQGAPGVGKTFIAKRLAYSIIGVKNRDCVVMVQFHQSYSYEDFIMGFRPSKEGFELKYGSFYEFCKLAEEDSENDYFFIIDEINRGNLSKIFGELFMLIEADKRGDKNKIRLVYSNELFFIPKNVYIIGLMNTADRSLAMIDYALRRRFAFFDLKPGFTSKGFGQYQENLSNESFDKLVKVIDELNHEIADDESLGEGFQIGHSFLCNIDADEVDDKLPYIINYELIPLLKEYWFDESDKIEYWSDKLRSVIDD